MRAAASLKVLVCAFVCSDGSGHKRFDGDLHPAVFLRHDGGYLWDGVHELHRERVCSEGKSGSGWRSDFHHCRLDFLTQELDLICREACVNLWSEALKGTLLVPPGLLALVGTSWYGSRITQEFYNPFTPTNSR